MSFPRQAPAQYRDVEGVRERWCTACALWKPFDAEHFNRDARSATGFQSPCKLCQRISSRKWQQTRYRPLARNAA